MILSAENVVHYLLERELIAPSAVVGGELMVIPARSRHSNFKVLLGAAGGLFVKQALPEDPQARATLEREATCYWLAEHDPAFRGLSEVIPAQKVFDSGSGVLVLDLLGDPANPSENLSEFHHRLGVFPPAVAARLGSALGHYHREVRVPAATDEFTGRVFPRQVPWVLNSAQLASMTPAHSGGAAQLMELVGRFPDFYRTLDALRQGWRTDSLIHGDMKWENCLVVGQPPEVRVIDWEMADFGDACWDVGAIFQSYLTCWLSSLPYQPGQRAAAVLHLAQFPIERMQEAMNAYWQAYAAARGLVGTQVTETLERSVRYAAARMIQTAYEHLFRAPSLAPHTLSMMQVSLNMLTDPRSAIRDLLELRAVA